MSYVTHADLGGQPGFGPVTPEPEGELFHADWEPRALALTLAMGATGSWNIDASRAVRETLPNYRDLSYYQIWLGALEQLMLQRAQVFPDEIASGEMKHPPAPVARVLQAANVPAVLAKGSPTERPEAGPARFAVGQAVRMHLDKVDHHTRLPGYVQGKRGTIEHVHGAHVFADAHAQGLGEQPQWLYTVVFEEAELWGEQATPQNLSVSVDAWESYLEAVA
ncbi:nitrile hydratase [Variovorax boronicumulans]|uniref:Nitrile hydratase subunit beta n=1 Tax=Variovorax boronicumulans TaxID=436515 RepID=A0AAW8CS54_9BURK|nr:nitrile hydratase subunit beta [Variovorax boronicumulans]MDP9893274.1 nitrile hydratase [Variovorax boronicumulans]MDQ0052382.1 nitrile hydratase [Variovorax boronicumulans]